MPRLGLKEFDVQVFSQKHSGSGELLHLVLGWACEGLQGQLITRNSQCDLHFEGSKKV